MSHAAAYRKVSGNDHSSDCKADHWMKCRGVEERIMELRRENDRKCTLSREAALQFLTEVVNTPIGAVTKDSRLAQAMKDTDDVHEIRMPDKLVAVQTLGREQQSHAISRRLAGRARTTAGQGNRDLGRQARESRAASGG